MPASPSTLAPPGTIQLSYDRETDTINLRLRPATTVERTEDAGEGRTIDYVSGEQVGITFRAVRRGIRTDGLAEELAALGAAAATFAAVARLLHDRDSTVGAGPAQEDEDETAYLLSSPANAARLISAYERSRRGEGEPVDLAQLRRQVGLVEE